MKQNKKKALIFGLSGFSELVDFYLEADSEYRVVAFTATGDNLENKFRGKPVVHFDDIEEKYPPGDYEMFISVGYRKMNKIREDFCIKARSKGYKLLSYISSKATFWGDKYDSKNKIGDNVFIFENNNVQPFVEIGSGTILWSGNHIGHHSKIGNYCYLTSHVVISGYCNIGDRCFLGVNSTLHEALSIGCECLIAAGACISRNTGDCEVFVPARSIKLDKPSMDFFK